MASLVAAASEKLLIVSCTKNKNPHGKTAIEVYSGSTMFRHLVEISKIHCLNLWIRSARYGFIEGDHPLSSYDQRLGEGGVFQNSSYPEGSGYWFGAADYFADAPSRFERLLPPMHYGRAEAAMNWLKVSLDYRNNYFAGDPPPSTKELVITHFREGFQTVASCAESLKLLYGGERDYTQAVKSILSDQDKHRGYIRLQRGNLFTLVKEVPSL